MFVIELLQFLEPDFRVKTGSTGRDDFADEIQTSGTEIFVDPDPIFPEEIPGKIATNFVSGNSGHDASKVLFPDFRRIQGLIQKFLKKELIPLKFRSSKTAS